MMNKDGFGSSNTTPSQTLLPPPGIEMEQQRNLSTTCRTSERIGDIRKKLLFVSHRQCRGRPVGASKSLPRVRKRGRYVQFPNFEKNLGFSKKSSVSIFNILVSLPLYNAELTSQSFELASRLASLFSSMFVLHRIGPGVHNGNNGHNML